MEDGDDLYLPASEFLVLVKNDDVPLSGSAQADRNLALLIELTRDADRSNRDWAALLLSQTELDTPEIRAALLVGTADADPDVRMEALVGLAMRDRVAALPIVAARLKEGRIDSTTLEAASYVAYPMLLPLLTDIRDTTADWDDGMFGIFMHAALESCATGEQPQWRDFDD